MYLRSSLLKASSDQSRSQNGTLFNGLKHSGPLYVTRLRYVFVYGDMRD
jgi:hypothetical protein